MHHGQLIHVDEIAECFIIEVNLFS